MVERATIARPYARAAFSFAREHGSMGAWSKVLGAAAAVAADSRVEPLIASPNVSIDQLVELFSGLGEPVNDSNVQNFMRLLAKNRRLALLPEIATQFELLRAEIENTAAVEVTSAVELSPAQRDELAAALKLRLQRDIKMSTAVDPTLLGGAVIRAGDLVIDGSLKARLQRLRTELSN